jgi:hypothetical protein
MIIALPSLGTILRINLHLFMSSLSGVIAWFIWPDTLEGSGWGFIAIILWANVFVCIVTALREMAQLYLRDKAVAAIIAESKTAKSDQLASYEDLRRGGMIDG